MSHRSRLSISLTAVTAAAALQFAPVARAAEDAPPPKGILPERAGALVLKFEPGVAIPLTEPQSQLFNTGGGATLKALWPLGRWLGVGPSFTFIALRNEMSQADTGRAFAYGATLRAQRPQASLDVGTLRAITPWADADALYVRTGDLNRAGFAVAVGAGIPLGASRAFSIGPFVRYFQILQGDRTGYDTRDAKILSIGVSLEVGPPARRDQPVACDDRDGDGVCRAEDRCRGVAGPKENFGCPPYRRLVIGPDKLELKENIYFEWDQAVLMDVSFPVLDEVVQALKDNTEFRVMVEGHASSEGAYDHNMSLSEQRAAAVLDYLATHGIGKERLLSKGFSSSIPIATNLTEAGREQNRRVEFVVHFNILNDGSK